MHRAEAWVDADVLASRSRVEREDHRDGCSKVIVRHQVVVQLRHSRDALDLILGHALQKVH